MSSRSEKILEEALEFSEGERADLAAKLLATLGPPTSTALEDDPATELGRRARAALAGEPGVPWSEVRVMAERKLRWR